MRARVKRPSAIGTMSPRASTKKMIIFSSGNLAITITFRHMERFKCSAKILLAVLCYTMTMSTKMLAIIVMMK